MTKQTITKVDKRLLTYYWFNKEPKVQDPKSRVQSPKSKV